MQDLTLLFGNSKSEEVSKDNRSTNSPNSAQVASGDKPDAAFRKAVGAELWNNAGDYTKQIFTGAFKNLIDNAPEAFADVSGYSSAVEIADAVKAGDGQALAIAVVVGLRSR